MDLAWRLMISMLPESHELHIPTHESDYTDWKLDQPPVKIAEYANFLADVVTRLITDADAEVGRWKEFLEKSSQLPPADRARVYDALEAVIATEAGNGQLQSGVWQTLRNITG